MTLAGKLIRTKELVQSLQKEQDRLFTGVCKDLKISPDSDVSLWVFDYLFNKQGTAKSVLEKVRKTN